MVELTLTIAWYNSGVRIMGLLDIDLEDSYRESLPDPRILFSAPATWTEHSKEHFNGEDARCTTARDR